MRFTVSINTDNEAFTDNVGPEIARILRRVADEVEPFAVSWRPGDLRVLLDQNGNRVGVARFKED